MDAYERIYGAMRQAGGEAAQTGALHIRQGKVLSAEPLTVEVAGTKQEAARFYVCERLLEGHTERCDASGGLQIHASCGYGSHNSMNVYSGVLKLTNAEPVLKAGDLVLLLTDDDQTFYLIDKVVRLT